MVRRLHARLRDRSRGFTLIEALVTVTVMVILLAVAVPSFRQLIANQRVRNASFELFSALNYARSEAVKRNVPVSIRAGASSDGSWSTGWRLVDPVDTTRALRSWNATTNLAVTEAASLAAVTFGLDGRVTATAAPKLSIAPTVAISGVTSRCITVDLSGRPTSSTGSCP